MAESEMASAPNLEHQEKLRKKRRKLAIYVPLLIVGLSVVLFMVMSAMREKPERKEPELAAPIVQTLTVEREPWRFEISAQGSAQPRTETELVAEVSGRVVDVDSKFVAGGFFKRGEVILTIDPSDYEVGVEQARAALAGRQAQQLQAAAQTEQAQKDWDKLGRSGQPNDLVLKRPQLAEAEAGVLAAQADLARAKRNLERTKLRAPYDAMVRSKRADVGQYVSPGTQIAQIFAVDYAEIRLPITSDDLAFIDAPAPGASGEDGPVVTIEFDSGDGRAQRQAVITRREAFLDESTRTEYLVARVDDPYGLQADVPPLPMGRFVEARIAGIEGGGLIVIPRYLVRRDNTVLVLSEDNQLDIRDVEIERSDQQYAFVTEGLETGDRVITSALEVPLAGMPLRPEGPRQEAGVATETAATPIDIPDEPSESEAVAAEADAT